MNKQLRQDLAEAQGWTDFVDDNVALYGWTPGHEYYLEVPHWDDDDGAALRLCLKIAWEQREFEQSVAVWESCKGLFHAHFINHAFDERWFNVDVAQGYSPAEALSLLALSAIRGRDAE